MSVTQREMVVQTSFYSFHFDFSFQLDLSSLVAMNLLCLLGWLLFGFQAHSFLLSVTRKKNCMQSGTIESMRELNHPRNTKYLWQRVQWIAKVAQMNVLKRFFFLFCFRARTHFAFFSFVLVWFGFRPFRSWVSAVRASVCPFFPFFITLTTSCCLLLHFQSFSSLPFILCLVHFRGVQEKIA